MANITCKREDSALKSMKDAIALAKNYLDIDTSKAKDIQSVGVGEDNRFNWFKMSSGWKGTLISDIRSEGRDYYCIAARKGHKLPLHKHSTTEEFIRVCCGTIKLNGVIYSSSEWLGKEIKIEKNEVHSIECLEDCILLVSFNPGHSL